MWWYIMSGPWNCPVVQRHPLSSKPDMVWPGETIINTIEIL